MKKILFLIICLSISNVVFPQKADKISEPVEKPQTTQQKQLPNDIVLEYQKHLLEETKTHREFISEYYNNLLWLLGGSFALIFGVVVFFSNQSIKGIKEQVNELFKSQIGDILNKKLEEINQKVDSIDNLIVDNKKRFEEQDNMLKERLQQLENQYKQGNRFLLLLSIKNCNSALPQNIINNLEKFLPNKNILWVDDNPEYNAHPKSILGSENVKFINAKSSEEGYSHFNTLKIDLVISDMCRGTEKEAGIAFMNELRTKNKTVPFILYTSDDNVRKYQDKILTKDLPNFVLAGADNLLSQVVEILSDKIPL